MSNLPGLNFQLGEDIDALRDAVHEANRELTDFETSCFDGHYITGDIDEAYLAGVEASRNAVRGNSDSEPLDLNLNAAEQNLI